MSLRTDFKDEVLEKDYRVYDLVNDKGKVIKADVHLKCKDIPKQVGDAYGAKEVNELNFEVNGKNPVDWVFAWNDITNKPDTFPTSWAYIKNKPFYYPPATHTHEQYADEMYYNKFLPSVNKSKHPSLTQVSCEVFFDNVHQPFGKVKYPPSWGWGQDDFETTGKLNTIVWGIQWRGQGEPEFGNIAHHGSGIPFGKPGGPGDIHATCILAKDGVEVVLSSHIPGTPWAGVAHYTVIVTLFRFD